MDVRILGPLEIRVAGGLLALRGTQARAMLAMLALHVNRLVSTDVLVDGLWGDWPPASAVNIVQGYVSRLRKALQAEKGLKDAGAAVLQRRGPGYLLNLDPEQVDLHRFQRLVREGTQALGPAPARAASTLREALGLWRGQPLAEFADTPFVQAEIPRLEQQRLAALEALLEAELALGRHAQLVGELEILVRPASAARGTAPAAHAQPVPLRSACRSAGGLPPDPVRGVGYRSRSGAAAA